jgi:hypothetical protein
MEEAVRCTGEIAFFGLADLLEGCRLEREPSNWGCRCDAGVHGLGYIVGVTGEY